MILHYALPVLQHQRAPRLPPGPGGPGLWNTFRYLSDPLGTLRRCRARHGDIFTLRFAQSRPLVILCAAPLLRELFSAPADVLRGGIANESVFGPVVGARTSLVFDGEQHLRRRRVLQPSLRGERMHEYTAEIGRVTQEELATWPRDRPFSMHGATQRIAMQVILATVFGLGERDERLQRLLRRLADEAIGSKLLLMPALRWDLGPWSPWGKIVRLVAETDRVLIELIARRRADPGHRQRNDILDLLLDEELTDEDLCDELITMLMAGHETTGTALAWAIERILAHPPVAERLTAEIAAVTAGAPIGREHLAAMPYLEAVIKESMRARPIMAFGGTRRVAAPYELAGYLLPEGANVTCSMSMLHEHPELYPDPTAFRPERFLEEKLDQYEFAPFGGGLRRCLGMAFALHEMKTILATIFQRVRLTRVGAVPRTIVRGFFLAPARGLRVTAG